MKIPNFRYNLSRLIEKARAIKGGWFWLPCPICGEMFSGREISARLDRGTPVVSLKSDLWTGQVVCLKQSCKDEAERRNKENGFDWGVK